MKLKGITKLMEFLGSKSKKERASIIDHTFIVIAGLLMVSIESKNLLVFQYTSDYAILLTPVVVFALDVASVLFALWFCSFLVRNYIH